MPVASRLRLNVPVVERLAVLAFLFPFVPGLVPGTDTQPLFMLFVVISAAGRLIKPRRSTPAADPQPRDWLLFVATAFLLIAVITLGRLSSDEPRNWVRIGSFAQFAVAFVWALANLDLLKRIDFRLVLVIYILFSALFVLTNGALEAVLIGSRAEGHFARLSVTGRGLSTLSPEPSFFALQIFNLYVIRWLLLGNNQSPHPTQVFIMSSFCWMSSLSGYGLFIFLFVSLMYATGLTIVGGLLFLSVVPVLGSIEAISRTRAMQLVLIMVEERAALAVLADVSFSIRLSSLRQYWDVIAEHPILGDAFSFAGGGGFISLIAGLGLFGGIIVMFAAVTVFLVPGFGVRLRLTLVVWFAINTISGAIAIPSVGVVLALLFWRGAQGIEVHLLRTSSAKSTVAASRSG